MTAEIARIHPPAADYEPEDIEFIKRTVAPGCTDQELQLFLYTCRHTGLDPLLKQIYCIKRGGKATIQVSIDGYRLIADRTGQYAGSDKPEFVYGDKALPISCTVTVYKLLGGVRCPFTATAFWDEYAQSYNNKLAEMWAKMPHTMLAKCAESLALRKAFPAELAGTYTNEEMSQDDDPRSGAVQDVRTLPDTHQDSAPGPVRQQPQAAGDLVQHGSAAGQATADPRKKAIALFNEIGAPTDDEENRAWISKLLGFTVESRSQLTPDHWSDIARILGLFQWAREKSGCPYTVQEIFNRVAGRTVDVWKQRLEAWERCAHWLRHDYAPDPYADEDNQPVEAEVVEEAAHA